MSTTYPMTDFIIYGPEEAAYFGKFLTISAIVMDLREVWISHENKI
jgi:hypothetical protein